MAKAVALHVGAMKSGTSYVQARIFANQETLRERGVLVPGRVWNDQVAAVKSVLGKRPDGRPGILWRRMVQEVDDFEGTAVVSMEFLGPVGAGVARRVVDSLDGTEVHAIVTARDLNRSLAAMWQETVQNGRTWTWDEYVAAARARAPGDGPGQTDRSTPGGTFWRQQHLVRMVRRWSEATGRPVRLVTLPAPGGPRDALWTRFCQATGIPGDGLAEVPRSNESLGLASILALRRLNLELDARGMPYPEGAAVRKNLLAKSVLASRRAEEDPLGLPVARWVRDQSRQTVGQLRSLEPQLFGSWDDLVPVAVPGASPADVSETAVTDAAVHALAELVAVIMKR